MHDSCRNSHGSATKLKQDVRMTRRVAFISSNLHYVHYVQEEAKTSRKEVIGDNVQGPQNVRRLIHYVQVGSRVVCSNVQLAFVVQC